MTASAIFQKARFAALPATRCRNQEKRSEISLLKRLRFFAA
jgi:hypothetical protein